MVAIKGYEEIYSITRDGKVYSLYKKEYKNLVTRRGYLSTTLWKNGKGSSSSIHRLVALAYIPNPENKPQVNHIDGDKSNNIVSNLEWATRSENVKHAYDTGLTKIGKRKLSTAGVASGVARRAKEKLKDKDWEEVILLSAQGMLQRDIASIYGVKDGYISSGLIRYKRRQSEEERR